MKLKYACKLFVVLPAIMLLASCARTTSQDEAPGTITEAKLNLALASLDSLANSALQKSTVPGMAIAVVHNNEIKYARGFGVRNITTREEITPETVFLIASLSKSIAATVVAGAVGHGRVRWDDPVSRYLPDFILSDPTTSSRMTIADMFSHRSGLPDHAGDLLEEMGYSQADIFYRLRYEPLTPYLSTYAYTNFGLTSGAQAVAVAEGLSWEDLSYRELYAPLGMTSTSSRWIDYYNAQNKADIHRKNDLGQWIVGSRDADAQTPAGGVSSNVIDLAKWMMLFLNEGTVQGKSIIDRTALLQIEQRQMQTGPTSYYGLGMGVGVDEQGRLRLSHSGAFASGTATTYEMLPSEGLGIVVLTNGYPMGIPEALAKEFLDIAKYGSVQQDWIGGYASLFAAQLLSERGELFGKTPPVNPVPSRSLADYAGTYSNVYYGPATITLNGNQLWLSIGPKNLMFALSHWDGETFSYETAGENEIGITAVKFTPAAGIQPASMNIEYYNKTGLGTFVKS